MNQVYTQFEFEDIANKNEPAITVFLSFVKYLKKNTTQMNNYLKTAIINPIVKVSQA